MDDEEELEEPCVQTHDQDCLSKPEFEALVEEIAAEHAAPTSFQNQWGLAAINADQAYANLELEFGPDVPPGEGVTVGVLDTGIDGAHPHFRNKTIIERFTPGATDEDGSERSHGTAVASIIAGEDLSHIDFDAQGVAWGADLVVFALPLGTAPELYAPIPVSRLPGTAEYFAERFEEILAWQFGSRSIDFLNLSLGVSGIIENYSEEVVRDPFAPLLPVILQESADEKVVFVWAAGNSHGRMCDIPITQCVDGAVEASSIDLLPGLAVRFPELQETTVAVVAISPEGEIAEFSNRCGIAAGYCLAAPGDGVQFSYFGPGPDGPGFRHVGAGGGTSLAAPMVTGGLAVMKQYFRGQISNTDLLARLLETANSGGIYADSAIYGRGLMDLGAATSPVGQTVVAMGDRVDSSGAALSEFGHTTRPRLGRCARFRALEDQRDRRVRYPRCTLLVRRRYDGKRCRAARAARPLSRPSATASLCLNRKTLRQIAIRLPVLESARKRSSPRASRPVSRQEPALPQCCRTPATSPSPDTASWQACRLLPI